MVTWGESRRSALALRHLQPFTTTDCTTSAWLSAPHVALEAGLFYFTITTNLDLFMEIDTITRPNDHQPSPAEAGTNPSADSNRRVVEDDLDRLQRCEKKINTYEDARLEAGRALQEIQEDDLYKERGYDTFEDYGDEEFGLSRSRLYQLIDFSKIHDLLSEHVGTPPDNEAQTRPLTDFMDAPNELVAVWQEALNKYDRLSKKKVKAVADDFRDEESTSSSDGPDQGSTATGSASTDTTAHKSSRDSAPEADSQQAGSSQTADGKSVEPNQSDAGKVDHPSADNDSGTEDSEKEDASSTDTSRTQFERRLDTYSEELSGLDEEAARSVLSVAETLVDDLASDAVEESRAAYDRFLQAHGGSAPQPLETDSAPSIISDLDTLPTLSGLDPEDVEVSKEGESGMLVSLPITMIPDDLQPEDTKSCLVDYHALVDAGMPPQLDLEAILQEFRRIDMEPVMNKTDSGIEWAALSLSPVTGCRHGCDFCYARDIANRFYPQGFTPTFYPERLLAIRDATLPDRAEDDWRYRNVFISSMGDLFGGWIPKFMIEAVLDEIEERDEFTFSFLTKYAKRLPEFDFPDNAWVGTSVISQNWVSLAEEAFADVDAENTWISAEPLKSDLDFDHLDRFDWVVYGAQTAASGEPALQPEWKWVEHLREQAREAGCNLFQKENLTVRPMESPHEKCDSWVMPELWD